MFVARIDFVSLIRGKKRKRAEEEARTLEEFLRSGTCPQVYISCSDDQDTQRSNQSKREFLHRLTPCRSSKLHADGKSKFCLPGVSVFGRSTIFSQLDNAPILVVQVLPKKSREVQSLPSLEGLRVRKVSAYAATVCGAVTYR